MYLNRVKIFFMVAALWSVSLPGYVANAAKPVTAKENVLKLYIGQMPTSLDPSFVNDVPTLAVLGNLMEGMVVRDGKGNTVPAVAESWTNEDNKLWTFKLRKDAKWSDGKPVTAHDYVYAIQRLADPATASPYADDVISTGYKNAKEVVSGKLPVSELGIKALDDYTVQITLTKPIPYMLELVSFAPLRKDVIEKHGQKWTDPKNFVGNGAYVIDQYVINGKVALRKNPNYWGKDKVAIEKVVYFIISQPLPAYNRYLANELDVVGISAPRTLFESASKEHASEYRQLPRLCNFFLTFNMDKVKDKRVRQAIQLGVERDVISQQILGAGAQSNYSPLNPNIAGAPKEKPEWATWPAKKRHEKARQLLAEAGYSKRKPLKLTYSYSTSDTQTLLAVSLQSMFKNIGVDLVLQNQEWKTLLEKRQKGDYELLFMGACNSLNDPIDTLDGYRSGVSYNNTNYSNPAFDKLVDDSYFVLDSEERYASLRKAAEMLVDDAVYIPLFSDVSNVLVKPWLNGYGGSVYGNVPIRFMSLKGFEVK